MDLVLSCVDNFEARITINQVGGFNGHEGAGTMWAQSVAPA